MDSAISPPSSGPLAGLPGQGPARQPGSPEPRRHLGGTAGQPQRQGAAAPPAPGRSAYQQRLDQMKIRIVEMSHRNMDNALRVMRRWMKEV